VHAEPIYAGALPSRIRAAEQPSATTTGRSVVMVRLDGRRQHPSSRRRRFRFLIRDRDRDGQFTTAFDAVLAVAGVEVVKIRRGVRRRTPTWGKLALAEIGRRLQSMRVCRECGQRNPEGARFCNSCAAALPVESQAAVRKTVTVLFCDLVGSTALGERMDPEVLREVMRSYHAKLRTILERHGGTVEKFIGDAAMAVFGIPQVHEDDALRAVRAAAEIRDALRPLNLDVRIGVNTGKVVAGEGETLVTGDAVNVAVRLEEAVSPGEVLLGEATYALVGDAVRTESAGPLELKGKSAMVPAYRLLEMLPAAPAFTAVIRRRFVGREEELGVLERALAAAIEQRLPQLATVVGPPGIGKSRLARELMQRSRARVLVGRCLSYGEGITYWPLTEIVSQVGDVRAALGGDDDCELAASRIAAAVGTAETATSSDEIAWGFRKLLEALAHENPLIVVLDDIHWAEPTLLDLIDYVSTFAQSTRLLLLCIARPELFDVRPVWTTPKPNASLVMLGPLAEEETKMLVEELREVPEERKTRIVEAAEGNPLFVEQFVAMQTENEGGEPEIPPTLQALLAARIDRLEPDERAVISRASVEGRSFHRGSVTELLPRQARPGVGRHLMTLVHKELIRSDRAMLAGDDGFRFSHILIRDAAYDSLPKRLRAELHERFADWLETRLGSDAPDEIVGYHLEQAYRYRVELGSEDQHARTLARKAGRSLAEAGRRAQERSDTAATCSLLGRAIDLLQDGDPELSSLLIALGTATFDTGKVPSSLELLCRAQSAAAAAGQRGIQLRARMNELYILLFGDPGQQTGAALAEAEAAITELQQHDDPGALAAAWEVVAQVGNMRIDDVLWTKGARHALKCARRAGSRREAAEATRTLVAALTYGATPVDEAITQAEQALADFPEERPGEVLLAMLYAFAGRIQEAEAAIERHRRSLLELGQRMQYARYAMHVGWIALVADRPERAEHELRAGAELLEAAGEHSWLSTVAAVLAEVLYRLGRNDEAEEWTEKSERAASPEDALSQALWRSTRAKVIARRNAAERAARLSAEAVEQARRCDNFHLLGDCLSDRAEVLRLLERADEARPFLQEALVAYRRKGIVPLIERTRVSLAENPA
jgi:class 3 adenylate cyclase/tetratricopeptide (TPR) repeat protein